MIIRSLKKGVLFGVSCLFRLILPIKKKSIVCLSYYGTQYSCNPKYISEFISNHEKEYKISWLFTQQNYDNVQMPYGINKIKIGSFKHLIAINRAEFIISNCRVGLSSILWYKKRNQKYIMTWHSSMGIKRIEADVEAELGKGYVRSAKRDSKFADLLISGCEFRTKIMENSFWYKGEILKLGTPRNDILFNKTLLDSLRSKFCKENDIPTNSKIILYAPTFRKHNELSNYFIDWDTLLSDPLFKNTYIIIRLHPNIRSLSKTLFNNIKSDRVIDVTWYPDMQDLLGISDILITDYSSSMFDMSLLKRPILLYAPDYKEYNRGTYLDFETLPFPLSITQDQLFSDLINFNKSKYEKNLSEFMSKIIKSYENGHACEAITAWIKSKSLK